MKKGLIATLVGVVVVAGAAVAAVPLLERHVAAQIKADTERDGLTTIGSVEVGLLDRKIVFNDLKTTGIGDTAIARWEATGLSWPLSELVQGRTPFSGLRVGDPLQAEHVRIHGMRSKQDRGVWTTASLEIDGFRLERYTPTVRASEGGNLIARIAAALSMGHVEQKDTTFTDTLGAGKLAISAFTIDRFDKGLVGAMTMTGVDIFEKPQAGPVLSVAEFKMNDLDVRRPLKTISATSWRPGQPIGRINLESGSMSGFSGDAMTKNGISLGTITQQTTHEAGDVKRSRMRVEGFVLAPPPGNREALQLRTSLLAMGLKELRLSMDCGGTEDRARNEVSIDSCALSGPDLGELTLSFKLVNADAPFWQMVDDGNSLALLRSKVGVAGAKIVLADRGLLDRVVKAAAITTGQPAATVRAGLVQETRRYQPPGILITEDLTKLLETVARFIESGGTITLEAKPETPLGIDKIAYFSRPGPDLMTVLGLSATLSK